MQYNSNDLEFVKATYDLEAIRTEFNKYLEIAHTRGEKEKADRFIAMAKCTNDVLLLLSKSYWDCKAFKEQNIELSSFYTNLLDKNKKLIIENEELKAMNERLINSKLWC